MIQTTLCRAIGQYQICHAMYGTVETSKPFVTCDWPEPDDVTASEALQESTGSPNAVHPRDWD